MDFPFSAAEHVDISNNSNIIWREARISPVDGTKRLVYSSIEDIIYFVRTFVDDVLAALQLSLYLNVGVAIKQIRPDIICVFTGDHILVGVVEVKKPGGNVLLQPTVLGDLLDQMLLVEGFYGMGPVIGILTTAEEWVVSWFPADSEALKHCDTINTLEASFSTRSISCAQVMGAKSTPSQTRGTIHTIERAEDVPLSSGDDNNELNEEMGRVLSTTDVVNIHTNPIRVLQLLCSAFQLMAMPRPHYDGSVSRCLLKFHKEIRTATFHPAAYDDILSLVDFNKFPSRDVRSLIALEDLGRGSTGKGWLCVTVTRSRSGVCVLKFDNENEKSIKLMHERDMWTLLYPEFSSMVTLENWSGADALVMPHFSTVLEHEREQYRGALVDVLINKFMAKGKVHKDVRWSNIGKYMSQNGNVVLVVFDLYSVVDYNREAHGDWIQTAVNSLYNKANLPKGAGK